MPASTPERPSRRAAPSSRAPGKTLILGIDPGTLVTGYGVIELSGGGTRLVASGMVRSGSGRPMAERLKLIHESLAEIIRKYRPDQVAIETAFCGKNAQSALKLGQARGVSILAAVGGGLPLSEYSPREVKKAVVGNGNASKQQVQYMIRSYLGMTGTPPAYDVTDALAVAVCHAHRAAGGSKRHSDWGAFLREHPEKLDRGTGAR